MKKKIVLKVTENQFDILTYSLFEWGMIENGKHSRDIRKVLNSIWRQKAKLDKKEKYEN